MENITSMSIREVLELLKQDGNAIREVYLGWSRMKAVVIMEKNLTGEQKEYISKKYPDLEYFFSERSPWEPGSENFISSEDREAILFPVDNVNPW